MTARAIYYSPLRALLKILGCFPTKKKGADIIQLSVAYLKRGYSLYIFPEGRRVLQHESSPRSGIERLLQSVPHDIQPVLVHLEWKLAGRFKRELTVSLKEVDLALIKDLNAKDIMQMVYEV